MTTIDAGMLAERAVEAARDPALDDLRTRTLWNLAAYRGRQDLTGPVETVHGFGSAGSWAYVVGAAMHARTQDDFYPLGRVHVGATVLPSVLAVGAADVFPALAAGYEVVCLVSGCYGAEAQARGLRPSGVFGALGAATGAAVAMGAGVDEVASAISLAAALSGGTNQAWADGSEEWMLQVGQACRSGVEAAQLAAAGMHAAPRAIQGANGWSRVFFGDAGAERLAGHVESSRPVVADVAIKPYPVSGIAQVPTELAVRAHRNGLGGPAPVVLTVNPGELAYPGSANVGPFRSRSDSLMSLVRCVAQGLTFGTVDFESLASAPGAEEQTWIDQITVVPDEALCDGEARLAIGSDSEISASAHEVLHPTWAASLAEASAIALATESSPTEVGRFASVLSERPSAADIVEVWS